MAFRKLSQEVGILDTRCNCVVLYRFLVDNVSLMKGEHKTYIQTMNEYVNSVVRSPESTSNAFARAVLKKDVPYVVSNICS
jgi:hypothetical protein